MSYVVKLLEQTKSFSSKHYWISKICFFSAIFVLVFLSGFYMASADQAVLHANTTLVNTTNGSATRTSWIASDWIGEIGTELISSDYLAVGQMDGFRAFQRGTAANDAFFRTNWTMAMPSNIFSANWIYACTAFNKTGTKDLKKFAIWNYSGAKWTEISDGGSTDVEWGFCFNVTGENITYFLSSGYGFVTLSRGYGTNADTINLNTMNITVDYVPSSALEVNLSEPDYSVITNIIQNTTFLVNATVFCRLGSCGSVSATIRYNATSSVPDAEISTTAGAQPFFINETPALSTKGCLENPLSEGEFCNITWVLNATDPDMKSWKIGVNFSSDSPGTPANLTENATVSVTSCTSDVTLSWHSLTFPEPTIPSPIPYSAIGNADYQYNITVNPGSCGTDIYIKGADFENQTLGYSFGIGNLTWSNMSNNYDASYNMTTTYAPLKLDVPQRTNVTTWYWLKVPPVFAANYNSTVYIGWVKNGEPSP